MRGRDYYKNGVVTSIVDADLNGDPINNGKDLAIDGKEGFTILGTIKTSSINAEIVRQEEGYTVSIDAEGYLNFSLKGVNVNSKYTEKTIVKILLLNFFFKNIVGTELNPAASAIYFIKSLFAKPTVNLFPDPEIAFE